MTLSGSLKVGVSGVRGIIGDSLTPSLVCSFAASFGEYVGKGRVIVGRDTRPAGEMIEHAVVSGLLSVGCQPMLIGVVPTPTIQIIVDEYNANGGIAITASHNPSEWNALKFIGPNGIFLNETQATELLDVYNQPDSTYVPEQDYRNIRKLDRAFEIHSGRIFDNIDIEAVKKEGFKVAVDCCNGSGALYSKPFLEKLGCEVVMLFDTPDGLFRRKPEPVPANIHDLCRLVEQENCDIGFAQDPDADRISVVRKNGIPAGEQYSVVLVAEHVLSKKRGPAAVNVQTTKAIEQITKRYGCDLNYTMVGEINVVEAMMASNAVIGGEGSSGGVIWPAVHLCRDSFSAMALILEMLAERDCTVDEILDSLPRYYSVTGKFECGAAASGKILYGLKKKYRGCNLNTLDGVRIDFSGNSWVLVRPSNTEPVVRITAEASTPPEAERILKRFSAEIISLLKG